MARGFVARAALAAALSAWAAPAPAQSVTLVPTWERARLDRDPASMARDFPDDPLPSTMLALADIRGGRRDEASIHAREAVARADRLVHMLPGQPLAALRSFGAVRAAEWAALSQGDVAAARAQAARNAADLPGISLTHAEVMRTAYMAGDVAAAARASDERDRTVASMPPGLPDVLTAPVPGTWAMPAQIRMASGDPRGALARLVEGGNDRTPASQGDRVDALFVEGIATLETGSDDAYALRVLRRPAAMDPTPRNRLWAAAAAMLSGTRPPPELLVDTSPQVIDEIVRLFAGITTEKAVRERLEAAWAHASDMGTETGGQPGPRVGSLAALIGAQRCETDFLMAVARGFRGDRGWVDEMGRLAASCPRTSEAGWAARAVASRWRTAR